MESMLPLVNLDGFSNEKIKYSEVIFMFHYSKLGVLALYNIEYNIEHNIEENYQCIRTFQSKALKYIK